MTPAAPASSQPERPDAFISYSRHDGEFVAALVRALEARAKDVWVDLDDIPKSADWHARVEQGIETAKAVVVVLSPALAASQICGEEIRYAIEHNKRLIPILRTDVEPEQLYPELNAPNWILARDQDDRDAAFEELIQALETDLAWLEVHARLVARSVEWDREDRGGSFLLRGDDLKTAQRWLAARAEHREQPTELQVAYIAASRRSALIRRAVAGVAALGVLALAGFLLVQRDRAGDERQRADVQQRLADSRRLSADAVARLETDPRRALSTAVKAHTTAPTPEATQALRQALMRPRPESTLTAPRSVILSAEFIDSATVGGQNLDGDIMRWAVAGGQPEVLRRGAPLPAYRSRFPVSRAANLVARPKLDSVQVATAAKGKVLMLEELLIGEPGNTRRAALSPDGRRLVTSGYARGADVWRVPARVIRPAGGALVTCAAAAHAYTVTCDDRARVTIWPSDTSSPPQTVLDAGDSYDAAWDLEAQVGTDEARLFVTSRRRGTVTVVDTRSGETIRTYRGRRFAPPVISADGERLLLTGTRNARVEDTGSGDLVTRLPFMSSDLFGPPLFDSTGSRVATYPGDGVRVWDVARGTEIIKLPAPDEQLAAVSISATGNYVGTVERGLLTIAEPGDASRPRSYRVAGNTRDLEFSRDDAFVVTAGRSLARVLERQTGRQVASFGGHRGALISASFGPSARTVVTVGLDGVAIVHDCPACAAAPVLVKRARAALRADG